MTDLIRHYKLGMKVAQMVNLVSNAMVVEEKIVLPRKRRCCRSRPLTLKGYKILVVDDEPDILTFLSTVLEDQGATVIQASDGEQALELALKEKPDLITLDLSMPGKNGGTSLRRSGRTRRSASSKVCIITGKPECGA